MASLNKRHQARNEQALQELLRTVPGNDRCADCQAANPGWASWSLGIFLCMRCGSLHRKLGTHISKVKSLSMDSWTADQVDVMRKNGNVESNRKFNPRNVKPAVPLDADEIDSAMERYIRQKYEQKSFMEGAPTRMPGVHSSSALRGMDHGDDNPPPPPPKTQSKSGKLFGFLGKKRDKGGDDERRASPSPRASTPPGKVMGAAFGVRDEGMEWKLVTLREMGFPDETRNSNVLKGVDGDLERAIESLVRLGEGSAAVRKAAASSQEASRKTTPAPVRKEEAAFGASVGASNTSTPQLPSQSRQPGPAQADFWESIAPASAPANPPQSLADQFGNMQLNQQSAVQSNPLFPNATGGYPTYYGQAAAQMQMNMTQSVPQLPPNGNYNPYAQQQQNHNPFMNTGVHSAPHTANPFLQGQATGSNPFFQQQQQQQQQQQFNATAQYNGQAPYEQQYGGQQFGGQPSYGQPSYEQQQQPPTLHDQMLHQQPLQQPSQPWAMQGGVTAPSQFSQNPYAAGSFHPTYVPQQNTGRFDKSSILALYNYPQLAPQTAQGASSPQSEHSNHASNTGNATSPAGSATPQQNQQSPSFSSPNRSSTVPLSGTKNPFKATSPGSPSVGSVPQDQSGRHSPDAFASLSARFVR